MQQTIKKLGRVFMTPRGEWNKNLKYDKLDVVKIKNGKVTSGYIASSDIESGAEITDSRWINLYDVLDGDVTDEFKDALTEAYENLKQANQTKDDLIKYVGKIPDDSNSSDIVSYVQEIVKNVSSDSELKELVYANKSAIEVLNGNEDGSIRKNIDNSIDKLIDNAPQTMNTFKKIYDWIESHTSNTEKSNKQIDANKTDIDNLKLLIGTLPDSAESKDIVNYITEYVSHNLINPDLQQYVKTEDFTKAIGRIDVLESDVNDLKGQNIEYEIISIESIDNLFK